MRTEERCWQGRICVDVVVLTRDHSPLPESVDHALKSQRNVEVRVHRIVGESHKADCSRLDAICRARNKGKLQGSSPWLMFLDDDVTLSADCIYRLVGALSNRPGFGALAADYLSQSCSDGQSRHVGMGATLFRRSELNRIRFRYDSNRCECQCCCDDLRSLGYRIGYLPGSTAEHRPRQKRRDATDVPSSLLESPCSPSSPVGSTRHILTCFNGNH